MLAQTRTLQPRVIGGIVLAPLQAALYGVSPLDPQTFAASAAILPAIALAAATVPRRSSHRVDPGKSLRAE